MACVACRDATDDPPGFGSFLYLLRFDLLDFDGALSLRFVRLKGIDQSHGDINPYRIRVPMQFRFVPFGNEAYHTGGVLNLWKVTRNLGENIIHRSGPKALSFQV